MLVEEETNALNDLVSLNYTWSVQCPWHLKCTGEGEAGALEQQKGDTHPRRLEDLEQAPGVQRDINECGRAEDDDHDIQYSQRNIDTKGA